MKETRTPLYAKQPNGRYKFAAYLEDPFGAAPLYADGLWIFQRNDDGQSAAHVCKLEDLPSDMLNAGRFYAQRDAIVKLLSESQHLCNHDIASRIVEHFARC